MATEAAVPAVQIGPVVDHEQASPAPTPDPLECPQCGGAKKPAARRCSVCARGNSAARPVLDMAPLPWAPRQATAFRLYCVMCGRSSEVPAPAARLSRCLICGGTQLTEDLT